MAKRFHMKADGSGPSICTASERACPNGDYGHHDSPDKVWASFELSMSDKTIPATMTAIRNHILEEVSEQRKIAKEWEQEAKNESDVQTAYGAYHPADNQTYSKFILSEDPAKRSIAAKRLNNETALNNFIETESDLSLLMDLSDNIHLSDDQADQVEEKITKLRSASEGYQFKKWHQMTIDRNSQTSFPNPPREAAKVAEAYFTASKNTSNFIKNFSSNLKGLQKSIKSDIDNARTAEERASLRKLLKTVSSAPNLKRSMRMGGISKVEIGFTEIGLRSSDKYRLHKALFKDFENQHQDFFHK